MKKLPLFFTLLTSYVFTQTIDVESFLKKYPNSEYQDIIIHNETVRIGTHICMPRYRKIKPILDEYQGTFSILDLGAAQGYYSFKIAYDYPKACCVMIDCNNKYHPHHGDILLDLCKVNNLDNVTYLQKKMNVFDLEKLNALEHFDVVLAFLSVHEMAETTASQIMIIESLLRLGNDIIIEVANDTALGLTHFIHNLSLHTDCTYLGDVPQTYHSIPCNKGGVSGGTGKLYHFRSKYKKVKHSLLGIKEETFHIFQGVFPCDF